MVFVDPRSRKRLLVAPLTALMVKPAGRNVPLRTSNEEVWPATFPIELAVALVVESVRVRRFSVTKPSFWVSALRNGDVLKVTTYELDKSNRAVSEEPGTVPGDQFAAVE